MEISDTEVQNLVKDQLGAAILTQMGGIEAVINNMVKEILTTKKFDKHGSKPQYGRGEYNYIEVALMSQIEIVTTSLLTELLNEKRGEIKAAVESEFTNQIGGIAEQVVDGLTKCLNENWRTTFNFRFEKPSEDE